MSKSLASSPPVSRRAVFAGAGTAGALAAAAALLPRATAVVSAPATTAAPRPADGGYQLTEHVQRYYKSARV